MHKPPTLLMASDNNSQHLRELGEKFAAEDPPINIRSIGGANVVRNNESIGVFTITIDDDSDEVLERVREIAGEIGISYTEVEGVTVELKNEPGSLGLAAGVLENANPTINVLSLQVVGNHGDSAIVLFGVEDEQRANGAREALEAAGYFVYPEEHDHLA